MSLNALGTPGVQRGQVASDHESLESPERRFLVVLVEMCSGGAYPSPPQNKPKAGPALPDHSLMLPDPVISATHSVEDILGSFLTVT